MSRLIIFYCGGAIIWNSVRKPHTSLIYCEAEVRTTNECTNTIQYLRHVLSDLYHIDLYKPTKFYNDNNDCKKWSKPLTAKETQQLKRREKKIR